MSRCSSRSIRGGAMDAKFEPVFDRLRAIMNSHRGNLVVTEDSPSKFALAGKVGPATLAAWKGKKKSGTMSVAWVEIGKVYVSYHLLGIYMNPTLVKGISNELKRRMQGKSCFNFTAVNEPLFDELDKLTVKVFDVFKKSGFIVD